MIGVIPAIDIMGGKCVRLAQGDFSKRTCYTDPPVDAAKRFEDAGLSRLHLVDLDGAKQGKVVNFKTLEKIAVATRLLIDFGGGIKTVEDVSVALGSGAQFISTGSIVYKNRPLFQQWIGKFGAGKFIVAADVRAEKIAITGWQEDTGISIMDGLKEILAEGITKVICTDISKDGKLEGPAAELYKKISAAYPSCHLIASGGISCLHDIDEVEKAGCKEVIIGKALFEGNIKLKELQQYL